MVRLYVDPALALRPPQEAAAIIEGHPQRAELIRERTQGLSPGWYVTTGLFGHDDPPAVAAGPFPAIDAARGRRWHLEHRSGMPDLWLEVVEPVPGAAGVPG